MKKPQYFNQNGMTLVELLAALGLFAVVIALSSTVIFQLIGSEGKTNDTVSVHQDANVLINEIRSNYNNVINESEEEKNICYNQREDLKVTASNGDNSVTTDNNCITGIDTNEPLNITILKIGSNDVLVQTTLTGSKRKEITLNIERDMDWQIIDFFNDQIKCPLEGNYEFRANNGNNEKLMFKEDCIVKGNAKITGEVEIKNKNNLTIEEDLFITNSGVINGKGGNDDAGSICVKGKIHFSSGKSLDNYNVIFKCEDP